MRPLRTVLSLLAAAALASAGCVLTSGQFVATYGLPSPLDVTSGTTFTSVDVDLNTISDYKDHKDELKRVEDLALIGDFTNNNASEVTLDAWIVPSAQLSLTPSQVQANGFHLWGPLTVAAHSTVNVDWDRSATLFTNRQALADEVRGDGHFALYLQSSGAVNCRVTNANVIVVVGAAQ